MKVEHSAVRSPIYELAKTFELDIDLGEYSYSLRIELFRNTDRENQFRCHAWELERFRLVPTSPQDANGKPAHECDDVVMVDRGIPRSAIRYPLEDIVAPSVDAAVEIVLKDLKTYLEHATLEESK